MQPLATATIGPGLRSPQVWLVNLVNVLGPHARHLLPGHLVADPDTLLQGLRSGILCHARVVHEHRLTPIVRADEAVTAFAVEPTLDDPVIWLAAKTLLPSTVLLQQERSIGKMFKAPVIRRRTFVQKPLRDRKAQHVVAHE